MAAARTTATKVLRQIKNAANKPVLLELVTETEDYKRLEEVFKQNEDEHIIRIEEEVKKLPGHLRRVSIRQPFHPSDKDPRVHITLDCEDEDGKKYPHHVTKDRAEQDK